MIQRLCIVGVGLIGGSLALALKRANWCREVVGAGRSEAHLRQAVEKGAIDRYCLDLEQAVTGADLVVLAVPMGAMRAVLERICPALADDAVITDVGSAKQAVVRDVQAVMGKHPASFVPGHPIAGTENSGVAAAFPELFEGRRVILTPMADTAETAVERVREMWRQAGANVVVMDAAHHDEVLAATSHLPHVVAYSLVDTLARMDERSEVFQFAAGGFRDFTRIASSDPVMWRDICLTNREPLVRMIDLFFADLNQLRDAIAAGDGDAIEAVFSRAKIARDAFIA
ncbi:MAG: prephenate dehydrogenase/arogenate dehydrogenase family protein [Pseudomonadota bacterium]|nr:prephenate dehydrogenase/arogenate dehydrogenase family protein [Pseudomonadota bacterium]